MSLDAKEIESLLCFDPEQLALFRSHWLRLMELAVWEELSFSKLGAAARLRKRLLEVGENLQSLTANRDWIPQPREQLKSTLGSSIKLRDSLLALERAAKLLEGGAAAAEFERRFLGFRQQLLSFIEGHENQWASVLDRQYDDALDGDD